MEPRMEERLEKGELVFFPQCPFALPSPEDFEILKKQSLRTWTHKNISYNPQNGRLTGYRKTTPENDQHLERIISSFSASANDWLKKALPFYRNGIQSDRASFRSEEEATRRLRHNARNDLLHIDAFTNRPTNHRRILRLYVNIHPEEPRVWVTSETLEKVVDRYGAEMGIYADISRQKVQASWKQRMAGWFWPNLVRCSPYDSFLQKMHHLLKVSDDVQEKSRKRLWYFPPGSMWVLFSDSVTHGELRGQYALEHSFFINPEVLLMPERSPAVQFGFLPKPAQVSLAA